MRRDGILAIMCLLSVAIAGTAPGQEDQPFGREHDRPRMRGGYQREGRQGEHGGGRFNMGGRNRQGAMIGRIINNPEIAEKIGLTEEQIQALKSASSDVQKEMIRLRAEMEIAGMEQAQLITETDIDENAVMKAVEKTGEIRTKMAKLQVKQLLLVKKTLSSEQIEEAGELMRKHRNKNKDKRHRRRRRDRDVEHGDNDEKTD